MSDCKFKIGETYKDREGGEWVLVARNNEYDSPLVFRNKVSGDVQARNKDGYLNDYQTHKLDILPNKRKEWVVTYVFLDDKDERQSYRVFKECEKITAEHCAKNLRGLAAFRDVRGPMLWEYEE